MAEPRPGVPRWVKVFGIIALVLVLMVVVVMVAGGGDGHGPGRHAPSGDAGGQPSSSGVVVEDHAPSVGGRG